MKLESQEFTGIYRRLIDLRSWDDTTVVGWLENRRRFNDGPEGMAALVGTLP